MPGSFELRAVPYGRPDDAGSLRSSHSSHVRTWSPRQVVSVPGSPMAPYPRAPHGPPSHHHRDPRHSRHPRDFGEGEGEDMFPLDDVPVRRHVTWNTTVSVNCRRSGSGDEILVHPVVVNVSPRMRLQDVWFEAAASSPYLRTSAFRLTAAVEVHAHNPADGTRHHLEDFVSDVGLERQNYIFVVEDRQRSTAFHARSSTARRRSRQPDLSAEPEAAPDFQKYQQKQQLHRTHATGSAPGAVEGGLRDFSPTTPYSHPHHHHHHHRQLHGGSHPGDHSHHLHNHNHHHRARGGAGHNPFHPSAAVLGRGGPFGAGFGATLPMAVPGTLPAGMPVPHGIIPCSSSYGDPASMPGPFYFTHAPMYGTTGFLV